MYLDNDINLKLSRPGYFNNTYLVFRKKSCYANFVLFESTVVKSVKLLMQSVKLLCEVSFIRALCCVNPSYWRTSCLVKIPCYYVSTIEYNILCIVWSKRMIEKILIFTHVTVIWRLSTSLRNISVFFQMEPYNSVMTARFQTVIARINSNFKFDSVDNGNVQR